jgi:hypothetical protein
MRGQRVVCGFVVGAVGALCLSSVASVARADHDTWIELRPTGGPPSARERHSAVYDSSTNRMIVFGGRDSGFNALDEVWVLENANGLGGTPNWTQLSPTGTSPGTRILHSAVYDQGSNTMIVFGGRDASNTTVPADVFVLAHANGLGGTPTWSKLSTSGGPPPARYRQSAIYDSANNIMTIFAGVASGYQNDVWVLSHANGSGGTPTWTQLSPTGGPPTGRSATSAIYVASTNTMTVFGGFNGSSGTTIFNDVWVLSHANGLSGTPAWTQLSPTGTLPAKRTEHTAIFDTTEDEMLVFGGDDVAGTEFNDVWALSHPNGVGTAEWTLLTPEGGPPEARLLHSAVYDAINLIGRMTVFGGTDGSNRLNDVWVLADIPPSTPAPALTRLALVALGLTMLLVGARSLRTHRTR